MSSGETIEHWLSRFFRSHKDSIVPAHEAAVCARMIRTLRILLKDEEGDALQLKDVQHAIEHGNPLTINSSDFLTRLNSYVEAKGDACRNFIALGTCETLSALWVPLDSRGMPGYLVLPESLWARALLKALKLLFSCADNHACPKSFDGEIYWLLPPSVATTLRNAPATWLSIFTATRIGRAIELAGPPDFLAHLIQSHLASKSAGPGWPGR